MNAHVDYFTDCMATTPEEVLRELRNAEVRMAGAAAYHLGGASVECTPVIYPNGGAAAAMTLVDVLNRWRRLSGLPPTSKEYILGNPAPRAKTHGRQKNGTPFCWFRAECALGVMTLVPELLSLAHRLGLITGVNVVDTDAFLDWCVEHKLLTRSEANEIAESPFRGADLAALLARVIEATEPNVPTEWSTWTDLGEPSRATGTVARIDNFGNVFVDALPGDVGFKPGGRLMLANGKEVACYRHLAEVPPGTPAVVIGSSGYGSRKFLMLTIQGESAADKFKLRFGNQVLSPTLFMAGANGRH